MLEGVSTASAIVLNGEGVCFCVCVCVCVCEGAFSSIGTVGCSMTNPHPIHLGYLSWNLMYLWGGQTIISALGVFAGWVPKLILPLVSVSSSNWRGAYLPPPKIHSFLCFSNNAHKRNAKGRGGWTMQRRRIAEGGRWKGKRISCTEENNYTQLCLENDWIYLSRRCIDGHH